MNKKSLTVLTLIIYLFFFVDFILIATMLIFIVQNLGSLNPSEILSTLIYLIFAVLLTIIAYKLNLIVENMQDGDYFNIKNSDYFKHIGISSIIFSIFYAVITYPIPYESNFKILATKYGYLKINSFPFLIFGLLCCALSEIFKIAFLTKEENDLTI